MATVHYGATFFFKSGTKTAGCESSSGLGWNIWVLEDSLGGISTGLGLVTPVGFPNTFPWRLGGVCYVNWRAIV